jgi:DNA-damage-inducible protein D
MPENQIANYFTNFENFKVRRSFDEKTETWYFSVVDIIAALTESSIPKRYWSDLKKKLENEGSEVYEKIVRLKMKAEDGKNRETDCFSTEDLLRLIQSVPSPKAEPFKLWLAKVGYERMQEIQDPEKSLNRARENWQKHGRSEKWIQQRMMGQETRNKLTDYWSENGVEEGQEFAILTNIIHEEWTGLSTGQHKTLKGLKSQNLRDHMTEAELLFTALAELSTRKIAENMETVGLEENKIPAKKGGQIAKNAKLELEEKTKQAVVSKQNFLPTSKSKKLK